MLLGIDVGGTFTDAVVVAAGKVIVQVKTPTTHGQLLAGILTALDKAMIGIDSGEIERVALSTTIVTNTLVEGKTDPVGLCLLPGPGMDLSGMIPAKSYRLAGSIDHRGREVVEPDRLAVHDACRDFTDCDVFAVSGKFSVRNPKQELQVARWIRETADPNYISLGSAVSGTLNFWRRTNSAYYNAAVWRQFGVFAADIETALAQRDVTAPVYVLKADGGTMPLAAAKEQPVEAIFTGPAASVLGIMAMHDNHLPAISLDIGGTTTDIALWQEGVPLFAARGANISGYPTAVRAFWLKSVGLGGDSFVRRENGKLKIGPMRRGPAMAMGGDQPTVSDAMIVAGKASFGDETRAYEAMTQVAASDQTPQETARMVMEAAAEIIWQSVEAMLDEQVAAPVYRVEDVVHSNRFLPRWVIGVGGAAGGLAPLVAKKYQVPCVVPEGAMVANAVGAAVARPTIDITLRADTAQGYFTIAELGLRQRLTKQHFGLADAGELASQYLSERAKQAAMSVSEVETLQAEEFNLVRGFSTAGKIITCRRQIKPGVLMNISGFSQKGAVL
ncbi:MAG: hydantoinase/oxoprolinase family protein [Veillonellales bacterium]